MMAILNLTQHTPTPAQMQAGVEEPPEEEKKIIKSLITFTSIPSVQEMEKRAESLSQLVLKLGYKRAMVGGAGYFMPVLVQALKSHNIQPLFAFSKREVEEVQEGNQVKKVVKFKFLGFVEL